MVSNSSSEEVSNVSDYIDVDTIISNLFPYESPYPDQRDGIDACVSSLRDRGYTVLEGACGTGKTLIALISAMGVIRDPQTDFEQVLVVTSVKQQQKAFESDINEINNSILDKYEFARDAPTRFQPITGLSLVGKGDLCPYTDSGAIERDSITPRCSALMNATKNEAARESVGSQSNKAEGAREIIAAAQSIKRDGTIGDDSDSHTNIEDNEHPPQPIDFNGTTTCPYYAKHLVDEEVGNERVRYQWSMLDADTLRQKATQLGTCPYMAMHDGISKSEVIIGNYAHVFHDTTVEAVTSGIINSNTIIVVDEAHMLVEKVREYESIAVTRSDIIDAIDEIQIVLDEYPNLSSEGKDKVNKALQRYEISMDDLRTFKDLVYELQQMVERVISTHLSETTTPDYAEEIKFRNPEKLKEDRFDKWIKYVDFSDELVEDAVYYGKAISQALRAIANDNGTEAASEYQVENVGELLTKKYYAGQAEYYFEIQLSGRGEYAGWSYSPNDEPWENYTTTLTLDNCMPAKEIQRQLSKFGGGILMSATISPMDVYTDVVGVSNIEAPVTKREYNLRFPKKNRVSYIVDLEKFTSGNRGDTSEMNEVREKYKSTLIDIINNVSGNTLICMPSYDEAEWAKQTVEGEVPNPLYLDKSSSNDVTMALKEAFEVQDDGVLFTSLRGTLTEGVDFSGEKLSNAVIVGIPITYPYSNRAEAIKTAYAVEFGRANAFDYSHTLPAVYKTRQAFGRVIRNEDEVGTRILIDERYTQSHYQSAHEYLSDQEQTEFEVVEEDEIGELLDEFWNRVG